MWLYFHIENIWTLFCSSCRINIIAKKSTVRVLHISCLKISFLCYANLRICVSIILIFRYYANLIITRNEEQMFSLPLVTFIQIFRKLGVVGYEILRIKSNISAKIHRRKWFDLYNATNTVLPVKIIVTTRQKFSTNNHTLKRKQTRIYFVKNLFAEVTDRWSNSSNRNSPSKIEESNEALQDSRDYKIRIACPAFAVSISRSIPTPEAGFRIIKRSLTNRLL